MIVLIRALTSDISAHDIWQDWSKMVQQILEETQVSQEQLAKTLDQIRDQQISQDFDHWLSLHRFYDGMSESLMQLLNTSDLKTYIITTKEGRFVNKLLKQHQVDFPEDHIFGKEFQQPKTLILKQLCSPDIDEFWFIEDRLKTLLKIQQEQELSHIKLFLADWGYNIATEQKLALEKGITVTNLKSWQEQLFQNFLNQD